MSETADLIRRPELEAALDSMRRELSGYAKSQAELRTELNFKLDTLINGKTDDARCIGALQQQVRDIKEDTKENAGNLAALRQRQEEPRDAVIRFFVDLAKLCAAAAVGYFLHWKAQ